MRLSWWSRPRELVADSLMEWEQSRAEGHQKFGASEQDLFAQAIIKPMQVNMVGGRGRCAPAETRYDHLDPPAREALKWI